MISTKFRRFSLLSIILLFTIVSMASAEDNWVLLHRGQGGDRDVYYDNQSIIKIDDNIMEVYIKVIHARNKYSVHQVQIDCNNQKLANGLSKVYVNSSRTERMDFSKPDWVWFPPMNVADKKLLNLACKKN